MESKSFRLSETFKALGQLISRQKASTANFNADDTYGESQNSNFNEKAIELFHKAYEEMGLAQKEHLENWKFHLKMKNKNHIDTEALFDNLRKLPSDDIEKLRLFNRMVGQQQLTLTISDFFSLQEQKLGRTVNPSYDKFSQLVQDYAALYEKTSEGPAWPPEKVMGPERETLMQAFKEWREQWLDLPGFRTAKDFFENEDDSLFNAFFHIQRQFDSDNWKNFDKEKQPLPQALPKIFSYRKAMSSMADEFENAEMSINQCFDYCKMSKDRVISFVLEAEDAFLNITTRLDDQYPIELDYCHRELHEQSHDVKLMLFPLRCLFFDELEGFRGVKDSNDHTLDSYMDMTLVKTDVHLPKSYLHKANLFELDPDIQQPLKDLMNHVELTSVESTPLVSHIQSLSPEDVKKHSPIFDKVSDTFEDKYKTDEENLSRRFARLAYLYLKAMEKKDDMRQASQDRLDNIKEMAEKYAGQADRFNAMEAKEDGADITSLKDDQLPLMASPEQMEDLYRTHKVVQRLAGSDAQFEKTAKQIQAGLEAAMKMMKEAGELMERMVIKIFPQQKDQDDLLKAIRDMINLGYETQQSLADLAKKESLFAASKNKKLESEIEKFKNKIEGSKQETKELQLQLRDILAEKRELVKNMRITQDEKDNHLNQLRMIAVMTINSLKDQQS